MFDLSSKPKKQSKTSSVQKTTLPIDLPAICAKIQPQKADQHATRPLS
jgi:hypothetical protein